MPVRRRDSVALTVVVAVLSAIGALVMGAVILLSGAPDTLLLPTVLAFLPVAPLVGCYLWLDRYEPEPPRLLSMGLAWGALVATSLALLAQIVVSLAGASDAVQASVVASITEEATKGLFLLLLLWWRKHEFDGILDGIVYAGMVGIGFAFVENILYLSQAYLGDPEVGVSGPVALGGTFVVRCLFGPFAHPFFTAFTGIGVGVAVTSRSAGVRLFAPVLGYLFAVAAHGAWNASAVNGSFLLVYGALMMPAFLLIVAFAIWRRRSERRMLWEALTDASRRGLLPAGDIPWLVDLQGRKSARKAARHFGGKQALAAMREYQQAAIELGYLHHRYLRGTAPADFAVRGQEYLMRLNAVRPYLPHSGQVVPTR